MPSPFPGMDPFLEHPGLFAGLHNRIIAHLDELLQARLPEPYYAEIGERIRVEYTQPFIEPDVNVLHPDSAARAGAGAAGSIAVASTPATRPVVVHVPHDEIVETYLEIYTRHGEERLVTMIEVLSLTNKTPGEHGRDLYLRKQKEVVYSKTHLVEIDLLRGGEHTTAVPRDGARATAGPFDYHVCIHHFDNLEDFFVYPIRLEERLPEIAIPLLPGDPAVQADLQTVFDRCYDTGPYRRRVRYQGTTPVPPLRPEQAEWATRLLREKGLVTPYPWLVRTSRTRLGKGKGINKIGMSNDLEGL